MVSCVPIEEVEVGVVPFRRTALRLRNVTSVETAGNVFRWCLTLNPSSVSVEDPLILIPPTPPKAQVFTS